MGRSTRERAPRGSGRRGRLCWRGRGGRRGLRRAASDKPDQRRQTQEAPLNGPREVHAHLRHIGGTPGPVEPFHGPKRRAVPPLKAGRAPRQGPRLAPCRRASRRAWKIRVVPGRARPGPRTHGRVLPSARARRTIEPGPFPLSEDSSKRPSPVTTTSAAGERAPRAEPLRDELKARQKRRPRRGHEAEGDPPGGARPRRRGQRLGPPEMPADIAAIRAPCASRAGASPRPKPLLRSVYRQGAAGPEEGIVHVARDQDRRDRSAGAPIRRSPGQSAGRSTRSARRLPPNSRCPVPRGPRGRGRASRSHPTPSRIARGPAPAAGGQLAGAPGGGPRRVARGRIDEGEPASRGHVHDGDRAAGPAAASPRRARAPSRILSIDTMPNAASTLAPMGPSASTGKRAPPAAPVKDLHEPLAFRRDSGQVSHSQARMLYLRRVQLPRPMRVRRIGPARTRRRSVDE